jgi:LacI family transcriptional regulator
VADCGGCMKVVIDNYRAGYEAAMHLIEQGCTRIAHLGGNLLRNVYSERLRGFRQALADSGMEPDDNLIFITEMSQAAGIEVADIIIKMKHRPDGVFSSNDSSAVSMIVELQKAGIRVPGDIAVVGFNNEPVSQVVRPNLSTIDYPAREMGEIAASSLISKLKSSGSESLSTIVLRHQLIIRESSVRSPYKPN